MLARAGDSGGKYTLLSRSPMAKSELMLPCRTDEKAHHTTRAEYR